ncbi:Prefoldin [Coprinellus micaceus]|uniref:Prefoldin n=1 Tax=Coprinellus micaceus TaxID=71717 RepID=A0A4Y7TXX5_COPMI|nr:Prefoldin [Coprinellus micaceus]
MSLESKLQDISSEIQKIQVTMSKAVTAREKLEAQLQENELVKKEFANLTEDNTVYKLLGPVLVEQDQAEARSTVDTRLDFIRSEMKRVEAQIKDLEGQMDKKKEEVGAIQTAIQTREAQNASATP